MIQPINFTNKQNLHQTFRTSKNIEKTINNYDILKTEKQKTSNNHILWYSLVSITTITFTGIAFNKIKMKNIRKKLDEMKLYPKDIEYRKKILSELGIDKNKFYKLRSIIGIEELKSKMEVISKDIKNFLPGEKSYRADGEAIFPSKENVKSAKFTANLHTHTIYSDGKFTIQELLEQAAKYGNERVKKLGKNNPFYIAITDHDTLQGCKEAINIILKNPKKYENLRLVLGIENTTVANYPHILKGPVDIHLISYAINPFDKSLNDYFNKKIEINKSNISKALDYANNEFKDLLQKTDCKYSFEDFTKLDLALKYGLKSADLYTKDYLQFKLIFSECVENNKVLSKFLKKNKIKMDYTSPIPMIGKNLDYSRGQKYYEYYFEAIKDYIKNLASKNDYKLIEKQLNTIPQELYTALNEFETSVSNTNSKLHVPRVEFPQFEEAVNFLKNQENCVLGIAHPGVAFPFANLKNSETTIRFYDELYRDFKKFGGDKAYYAEDNYAAYFKKNEPVAKELSKISNNYGLKKIGGLDTHIKDIFSSK